jgi:hypothetical protein
LIQEEDGQDTELNEMASDSISGNDKVKDTSEEDKEEGG